MELQSILDAANLGGLLWYLSYKMRLLAYSLIELANIQKNAQKCGLFMWIRQSAAKPLSFQSLDMEFVVEGAFCTGLGGYMNRFTNEVR